jgi:hypothetical protein
MKWVGEFIYPKGTITTLKMKQDTGDVAETACARYNLCFALLNIFA